MRRALLLCTLPTFLFGLATAFAAEPAQLVKKTLESFDDTAWPLGSWNRAGGKTQVAADVPEGVAGKSLSVDVIFSGKGFEFFAAGPISPVVVPGVTKSFTLRYKVSDKRFPFTINFKDGWGRAEVDKKKMEWAPPVESENKWLEATFQVPEGWVQPISVVGLGTHNWNAQNEAVTVHYGLDQLDVETNLADVDLATGALKTWKPDPQPADAKTSPKESPRTPLLDVEIVTGRPSNLFVGDVPEVGVRVRNWNAGKLEGTLELVVTDADGKALAPVRKQIAVESLASVSAALAECRRFGLYTVEAVLRLGGGEHKQRLTLARLPALRTHTEQEKTLSPYGINVNSARERFDLEPFRLGGIVWFRDYAFGLDWIRRAKGDDRRYAGWPTYPAMVKRYLDAGVRVLPCLMRAIQPPMKPKDAASVRIGPDNAWRREIADFINTFPQLTWWELDNEYDLQNKNSEAEDAVDWRNYLAFHRALGEILAAVGPGELSAVEQGTAGIYPDRVAKYVASGDFDKVAVVNSHYYCGTEAPEVNLGNWNTGFEGDFRAQSPMFFYDRLRAQKQAAISDGKPRQSWLTEFGWDTLAGPVVSPRQQAAYLARGWLVALAAGTDKCFWFYDYDAPQPKIFFDGCGLLAADGGPKLSLCALAGLTRILPQPRYVGSLWAGEGTQGYVFRDGDKMVAALWSIEKEAGPEVQLPGAKLFDYFGNPLPGDKAVLGIAPIYAVGIGADDRWRRQTAYELASPLLMEAAAGDPLPIVVQVANPGAKPLAGTLRCTGPKGWKTPADVAVQLAPGETKSIPLTVVISSQESDGRKEVRVEVLEKDALLKAMPVSVIVRPPLMMEVGPLLGKPGAAKLKVKVGNKSNLPLDCTLRLKLPKSWSTAKAEIALGKLAPNEKREVACEVNWKALALPTDTAMIDLDAGDGRTISRPIIPNRYRIPRAKAIRIDGKADDWPAAAEIPQWMLGSTRGAANVKLRLAWAPEGLFGLAEVNEVDAKVANPREFWAGNCLEVFVDTRDDKTQRGFNSGDHQFWLVPLAKEQRAYFGQWKRADEIAATRYDIQGLESAVIAAEGKYVMEFRIPAKEIQGYRPAPGGTLGVNLNLNVSAEGRTREVFWPTNKAAGVPDTPATWGTLELGE